MFIYKKQKLSVIQPSARLRFGNFELHTSFPIGIFVDRLGEGDSLYDLSYKCHDGFTNWQPPTTQPSAGHKIH